jgi:arsenate reductase-like glutaredoxin family protein
MPCKCVPSVDVTIYGIATSPETNQVRDFLNRKGVRYEEFDVLAHPQFLQELRQLSGQTERPAIVVNDRVFVGFDRSQLESAIPSLF